MNDTQARLTKCFSSVFPKLSDQEIVSAGVENVEEWDSVMTITLLTVIEEEFGIEFEVDALERLTSYQSVLDYVSETTGVSRMNSP